MFNIFYDGNITSAQNTSSPKARIAELVIIFLNSTLKMTRSDKDITVFRHYFQTENQNKNL